jgi:hypothetical protein
VERFLCQISDELTTHISLRTHFCGIGVGYTPAGVSSFLASYVLVFGNLRAP